MNEKRVCFLIGASGGLGRSILRHLIEAGYRVIATDVKVSIVRRTVKDLEDALGDSVEDRVRLLLLTYALQRHGRRLIRAANGISARSIF